LPTHGMLGGMWIPTEGKGEEESLEFLKEKITSNEIVVAFSRGQEGSKKETQRRRGPRSTVYRRVSQRGLNYMTGKRKGAKKENGFFSHSNTSDEKRGENSRQTGGEKGQEKLGQWGGGRGG